MSNPSKPAGAPEVATLLEKEALEAAFYDWWSVNSHALVLGGCGDVVSLWVALNAAKANAAILDSSN